MSLADYLAKNYLNAEKAKDKKSKKRKKKGNAEGLIIADDDISGLKGGNDDEDDDDAPMIVGSTMSRKSKSKSTSFKPWKVVGIAAPSTAAVLAADAEREAADRIIRTAAEDRQRAADAEDEAPAVEDTEGLLPLMESGASAGLQTAAQVAAATKKKQDEERKKALEAAREAGAAAQETVYRDASGRVINVAKRRAEEEKKREEEERKKKEQEIAARGDVQRAEQEKRKERLQDAKFMNVARHADDAELNEEQKAEHRWNDPAAGFLVKKKEERSVTGKPLYQGASAPNRYGIRPGHRWDGVDRSNGFEKKWFQARNRKQNAEQMEYAWQIDV